MEQRETSAGEESMAGERREEFRARATRLVPPEFRMHINAARKEFWLAIRSLIDHRIESLERAEKAASNKRATRVSVE